jgi:hypothetical protein
MPTSFADYLSLLPFPLLFGFGLGLFELLEAVVIFAVRLSRNRVENAILKPLEVDDRSIYGHGGVDYILVSCQASI